MGFVISIVDQGLKRGKGLCVRSAKVLMQLQELVQLRRLQVKWK